MSNSICCKTDFGVWCKKCGMHGLIVYILLSFFVPSVCLFYRASYSSAALPSYCMYCIVGYSSLLWVHYPIVGYSNLLVWHWPCKAESMGSSVPGRRLLSGNFEQVIRSQLLSTVDWCLSLDMVLNKYVIMIFCWEFLFKSLFLSGVHFLSWVWWYRFVLVPLSLDLLMS